MKILKAARLGALLGASLLVSVPPAGAEEGVFMKDMLGTIGIIPKARPNIEYRERAPLVLPPRMDLREPARPGALQASNPQWPKDPDVAAARRLEAEARVPVTETERRRLEQNPTLSPTELSKGRRAPTKADVEASKIPVYRPGDNSKEGFWVPPDQLRAAKKDDESILAVGVEPERRDLTEPPTGFRKATAPLTRDFAVEPKVDESDPKVFMREQAARR